MFWDFITALGRIFVVLYIIIHVLTDGLLLGYIGKKTAEIL